MVAPVTGPFAKNLEFRPFEGHSGLSWKKIDVSWYRQKKPYSLPLNYFAETATVDVKARSHYATFREWDACNSTGNQNGDWWSRPYLDTNSYVSSTKNAALNQARTRFNKEVRESASLALLYFERKQAADMVTRRLIQMGRFVSHLRKFRFRDAYLELVKDFGPEAKRAASKKFNSLMTERRLKRTAKGFANNFLEYWFGWSATVSDIYNAVDILQNGVPPAIVRGFGRASGSKVSSYTSFGNVYTSTQKWDVKAVCGASVVVSNPNLFLANQLGLVNPALWLYELITLSFVANWFLNIEEFISQFTEYWGLTVSNPFYSTRTSVKANWSYQASPQGGGQKYTGGGFRDTMRRVAGSLPSTTLMVRQPWKLSLTRGLSAASLLAQRLRV